MFAKFKAYLYIAIILAFAITVIAALQYRSEAISAKAEAEKIQLQLDSAIDANKKAVAAIEQLKKQSEIDGRLAADLAAKNRELENDLAQKDAELDELEKNDPSAKEFLDTPVPDSVSKLHDH